MSNTKNHDLQKQYENLSPDERLHFWNMIEQLFDKKVEMDDFIYIRNTIQDFLTPEKPTGE